MKNDPVDTDRRVSRMIRRQRAEPDRTALRRRLRCFFLISPVRRIRETPGSRGGAPVPLQGHFPAGDFYILSQKIRRMPSPGG